MILKYRYLEVCKEIEDQKGRTYWQKIKDLTKYTTHHHPNPIQASGQALTKDEDIAFRKNL